MMDDGSPIDIRQSKNEIAITSQSNSPMRHVYLDGRAHPSADTFDPTTLGNSIGHWSGDTLIVDTVGFNDAGLNAIPGGGVRNENSHLIEQYKLTDEGRKLQVIFTWIDDKTFTKPHTYAFMYEKLPSSTTAREWLCDPMDGARARFLIDPPQPPKCVATMRKSRPAGSGHRRSGHEDGLRPDRVIYPVARLSRLRPAAMRPRRFPPDRMTAQPRSQRQTRRLTS